jgi:hypothetical protein
MDFSGRKCYFVKKKKSIWLERKRVTALLKLMFLALWTPTTKSKLSFPYQITGTPYLQRPRNGVPAVSGHCTSDHKDTEYGHCEGKEGHRAAWQREGER